MKIGQFCFFRLTSPSRAPLRLGEVRLPLPGPARPDAEPQSSRTSTARRSDVARPGVAPVPCPPGAVRRRLPARAGLAGSRRPRRDRSPEPRRAADPLLRLLHGALQHPWSRASPWTLALGRDRDTTWWRPLRLDVAHRRSRSPAVVVHWCLLRPTARAARRRSPGGHPAPRRRTPPGRHRLARVRPPSARTATRSSSPALAFPVAWLVYTLVRGAIAGLLPLPVPGRRAERGYAAVSARLPGDRRALRGPRRRWPGRATSAWRGRGGRT